MIFLLNQERVLLEMVELARLRVAGLLRMPVSAVTTRLELEDGRVAPVYEVEAEKAAGVPETAVQEVIASVHAQTMTELTARMEGLRATRREIRHRGGE